MHSERKTIYLDNGATSFPKAPGVGAAMARYIEEVGANVNRGTYRAATDAETAVLETREAACRLFGFSDPTHAVFTPGMTAGMNMLLKGFLKAGDHVIVSSLEHNATMRPLMQLQAQGVEFSRIPAGREGETRAEDLLPLIKPNTKLVCVMHASNVCGAVLPIEEIAALCHAKGLPLAVDAAQTAGHFALDFSRLGLSALCMPAHKGLLGAQGLGLLLLEKEFAKQLNPLIAGGTGSASDSEIQPPFMPDRFESGTPNLPGVYGLRAALGYIETVGVAALRQKEQALTKQLLEGLEPLCRAGKLRIPGASLAQRVGVVSLDAQALDNAALAFRLEQQYGISTRCGLHCAPSAHKSLGTFPQGTVRLSPGYATTAEEIDICVKAVREILG